MLAKLRGLDGEHPSRTLRAAKGMGVHAALDVLSKAPIEKGTPSPIPEGFSLRQIADAFGARTQITAQDFLAAATTGASGRSSSRPNVKNLEGFLFPETYFVGERENATASSRRMVEAVRGSGRPSSTGRYPESRASRSYQALIIASLVEREARVDEDRPKVAAVIYNRLAKGMRLQIDITALYGLDEHKVPTRADLRRESPYNTYLIDGLPPTPIANPGLDVDPGGAASGLHDAIYYVVIDPSGQHGFTDDPQEFERLKQQRPAEVH